MAFNNFDKGLDCDPAIGITFTKPIFKVFQNVRHFHLTAGPT